MTGFGAQAYKRVSVDTGVSSGDSHALVLMLYDGAIAAARQALGHMQAGRVAEKAAALSKASRIIEEGLKVSLDPTAGGQLAQRLSDLYGYMTMRLLQANLRNDPSGLTESLRLLEELRGAWASIRQPAADTTVAAANAKGVDPAAAAPTAAPVRDGGLRRAAFEGFATASARGFAASA
jgi:flagellar secretion chaperone FliS